MNAQTPSPATPAPTASGRPPALVLAWARWSGLVLAAQLALVAALGIERAAWLWQGLLVAVAAQAVSRWLARSLNAPRPFAVGLSGNHLRHSQRGGFPSTHATVMGAIALWWMLAGASPLQALLGTLIAISTMWARVVAGAHFARDVFAGWLVGAGVAAMAMAVERWLA